MKDEIAAALRSIMRVQGNLIAEAKLRAQREKLIVNVLSRICSELGVELADVAEESESGLAEAAREIEQLEKLLKLDPPEQI